MLRGKVLEWLGDFTEARNAFECGKKFGAKPDIVAAALSRIDMVEKQVEDAKTCLVKGDANKAHAILTNVQKKRSSAIVELHLARANLAIGKPDDAHELIENFLSQRPDHELAHEIQSEITKAHGKKKSVTERFRKPPVPTKTTDPGANFLVNLPARLTALEKALDKGGDHANKHIEWLRNNSAHLQMVNWADDIDYAKAAHFAFTKNPARAIRNYDSDLITKSVEYGYIMWPRRIQGRIVGKSVLDVGCGFGAFGNGFLIAGVKNYTGIDPQMPLDSSRVKNKRKRQRADLGITPNEIMKKCPDIHLINGVIEDLETKATYDVVVLHNVTEHLHNVREIIPNIRTLLNPGGHLIYHHHNFYCWNGHHKAPTRPEQYVSGLAEHDEVADWNHIVIAPDLPDDHYFNTNLNQIRLDEIKDVTYDHYQVEKWVEIESPQVVVDRLTDDVFARLHDFDESLTRRDLMVNAVLCIAQPK